MASRSTERERALNKLRTEIAKGVDLMRAAARQAGPLELAYLLHVLRLTRPFRANPEEAIVLRPEFVKVGMALTEDSAKYAVQMCLKHGCKGFMQTSHNVPVPRLDVVTPLLRIANELNHKYDIQSMLSLLDVSVSGERDQIVQINLARLETDSETKRLYQYFMRLDFTSLGPGPIRAEVLLAELKRDFAPYADLFEAEFGVTVETYFRLLEFLLGKPRERLEEHLKRIPEVAPGRLDIQSKEYFLTFFGAISLPREKIVQEFGQNIEPLLARLTFDPAEFNDMELRFNAISRAPLIAATPK